MADFIFYLELFGVLVFAAAGALEAGRARLDFFGVLVVALVTALGGGTLRNLVLGLPAGWVDQHIYIWVALAGGSLTFLMAKFWRMPFRALLYADAVGLSVFVVTGSQIAINNGASGVIVVMLGMASGIVGGVIRDVLCNEVPLIFRRDVYATAALVGALVYLFLVQIDPHGGLAAILSILTVLLIRAAAIQWHLSLPGFLHTVTYRQENRNEDP